MVWNSSTNRITGRRCCASSAACSPIVSATRFRIVAPIRAAVSSPTVGLAVDPRTREQLAQALLGLTEAEIENALAKAAITHRGIGPEAVPLILDEKRSVIRRSGALAYSHPEPVDHLGGYANLRALLQQAAVTFSPAARAFGVEPS